MVLENKSNFNKFLIEERFFDYNSQLFPSKVKRQIDQNVNEQHSEAMANSEYLVAFSTQLHSYCVGCVDIVNSTKISANIQLRKLSNYYEIFLNSMSKIIRRFRGKVIKNVGDSVLYYFPQTTDLKNKDALIKCLECSFSMIEAHDTINDKLFEEKLPSLDYRISLDYGPIMMAHSSNALCEDIFGPPVNMCSKINRLAIPNTIVIGGDLCQLVRSLNYYKFEQVKGFSLGFKHTYPTYSLKRRGMGPIGSILGILPI